MLANLIACLDAVLPIFLLIALGYWAKCLGLLNRDDVKKLREIGADAVLVGEALMKAADKKQKLNELRGRL